MKDFSAFISDRKPVIDSLHRLNCSPTVVLDMDADIGRLITWLDLCHLNAGAPQATILHAVMRAAALSLRNLPLFNSAYNGRYRIIPSERIDICAPVTVEIDPAAGGHPRSATVFVVVPQTDSLKVSEIAKTFAGKLESERQKLSKSRPTLPWYAGKPVVSAAASAIEEALHRARTYLPPLEERWMKARREEFGTFTITDVSSEGITACHGQLAKPFIAGLTILAVRDDVVIREGAPVIKKVLPLVLEFDHKLTDAGTSAKLLGAVREYLEDPERLA